jgi:hypothetical protein
MLRCGVALHGAAWCCTVVLVAHEPRPPNWNCTAAVRAGHPGVVPHEMMIDDKAAAVITGRILYYNIYAYCVLVYMCARTCTNTCAVCVYLGS